ncbi:MAG: dihydroorotate dehydrogenase [Candidatus Helarchaeota archaeon]|nr:dihydroorotate dehydrogenase [Candidatus Helarchaeota archaeon]
MIKIQSQKKDDIQEFKSIDTSIDLFDLKLKNPLILASGILGVSLESLMQILKDGAGAVVSKSIGFKPKEGYVNPIVIEPMENVFLNAVGLPNPGYKKFIEKIQEYNIDFSKTPLIISVWGGNEEEFNTIVGNLQDINVKIFELNISCPHSDPKSRKLIIGQMPDKTEIILKELKKIKKKDSKFIIKLSPNVTDITEFVKIAVSNGIDGITAINTVQALEVDPYLEMPVLANYFGGQSGPSIRCIAQKKLADIILYLRKINKANIPVIGVGGIRNAEDVMRFLLLGVQCVQIGSAMA